MKIYLAVVAILIATLVPTLASAATLVPAVATTTSAATPVIVGGYGGGYAGYAVNPATPESADTKVQADYVESLGHYNRDSSTAAINYTEAAQRLSAPAGPGAGVLRCTSGWPARPR